jgi:hypothetical protein
MPMLNDVGQNVGHPLACSWPVRPRSPLPEPILSSWSAVSERLTFQEAGST